MFDYYGDRSKLVLALWVLGFVYNQSSDLIFFENFQIKRTSHSAYFKTLNKWMLFTKKPTISTPGL
jgi:hypothetical protein